MIVVPPSPKPTRNFEVRSPRVSAIARVAEHNSHLFAAGTSDYGAYDTATFEKDVTAVVNVTFSLR